MQNYEQILAELGIEIPEEKKADLKKKMSENYKTVADYNKQVEKCNRITTERDEYKTSVEDVQSKLSELEKEDVNGLKEQISTLKTEIADKDKAMDKLSKQVELKEKVNDFLSGKKFVNTFAEEAIRKGMLEKLEEENGKNAEDVFNELYTTDGKVNEGIFVEEKKEPKNNLPSFTTKFNSGERKKGVQKLNEMSLDAQIALKAEDPDLYNSLANDK